MSATLFLEQLLNGLQFGLMLFLIAAGLTLVFGILDILNVAHGSLYMAGAYVAAWTMQASGSLLASVALAVIVTGAIGLLLESVLIRRLVVRDHLAQVLGTFAIVLIANDLVRMIWGPAPMMMKNTAEARLIAVRALISTMNPLGERERCGVITASMKYGSSIGEGG